MLSGIPAPDGNERWRAQRGCGCPGEEACGSKDPAAGAATRTATASKTDSGIGSLNYIYYELYIFLLTEIIYNLITLQKSSSRQTPAC
jgi:hypothetical protein